MFHPAKKQAPGQIGKNGERAANAKPSPRPRRPGKYNVVIVDPPWPVEKIDRDVPRTEQRRAPACYSGAYGHRPASSAGL